MSWTVYARCGDRSPLGDREAVEQAIASAVPGVRFYHEPSGPEKIAVTRERGVEFPEVVRRHLEQQPASRQGDFEGDGFFVWFFLGAEPQLGSLPVELRGESERAVPLLRQLAARTGWVVEGVSGEPITL
jgi:hypothetical protein